MNYVITRHAVKRFVERVGGVTYDGAYNEIKRLTEHAKPGSKLPRWAIQHPDRAANLTGVIVATTWRPLRPGWERDVRVAFPVAEVAGRAAIVTAIAKRGTRERTAR